MYEYKIKILSAAERDMRDIFRYISIDCENVPGAVKVLRKIRAKSEQLSHAPQLKPALMKVAGREIRFLRAGKYTVVYHVDDVGHTVYIDRVLLSRRNLSAILSGED